MLLGFVLAHYLYPSFTNNHKAKLLHNTSILLLSFFLIAYQLILQVMPITGVGVLGYAANIAPEEIVRLTNEKRSEAGVSALQFNASLAKAARAKGEHMLQYDYWAHTAPDGTEPWKFFTDIGYKYRYAGENLARDFSNPQSAIDAWMASPSHRNNMLSNKYREIGVAVVEGDLGGVETTLIVQFFGTRLTDTVSDVQIAQAQPAATSAPVLTPTPIPTSLPKATTVEATPTPEPFISFTSPTPSEQIIKLSEPVEEKADRFKVLISPFSTTRGLSIATTALLLTVMIVDGLVVARRKIPRVGGRTFAHLAFLGMILAILLIAKAGKIL